jgi:hypothetical protein
MRRLTILILGRAALLVASAVAAPAASSPRHDHGGRPVGQLAGQTLDALIALMEGDMAYVDVHTTQFPPGEIRGRDPLTVA